METAKKWIAILTAGAICLVGVAVVCLFKIRSLSEEIAQLYESNSRLGESVRDLRGELSSLRWETEDEIKAIASLFETVEYTVVGPGTKTDTVECRFRIVPKLVSEDMELELTVGDATGSLNREGNGFVGSMEIKIFDENQTIPTVAVKSAAGIQTQQLEEVDLYWACREWLPELYQTMSGVSSTEEGLDEVNLAFGFRYDTEHTPVTFIKLTEIQTVDGQEVSRRDVTNQLRDGGELNFYEYYTDRTLKGEETVVITVRAEDSLGYIHELKTHIYPSGEPDGSPEIDTGFESIYTSDGKLLYGS